MEEKQRILSEKQESISRLEQSLSKGSLELAEREKKMNDTLEAEVHFAHCFPLNSYYKKDMAVRSNQLYHVSWQASLKLELERQKKITAHHKVTIDFMKKGFRDSL